jgi:hypothetical protein
MRSVAPHRLFGSWRGVVVQPASSSNPRAKPESSLSDRLILAAAGFIEENNVEFSRPQVGLAGRLVRPLHFCAMMLAASIHTAETMATTIQTRELFFSL